MPSQPSLRHTILAHRASALLRRGWWRLRDRAVAPSPRPCPQPDPSRPLRVGFVVCEDAKWGLGSVWEALRGMTGIETGFYPTLSDVSLRLPRAQRRAHYDQQRTFFAGVGPIWGDLYHSASDRMQPLSVIDCDLVFVQQPWGMQDLPRRLSGRIATAYVHYGMAVISNDRMQFGLPDFHPWLWRYFIPTHTHAAAIQGPHAPPDICVTGHPKFDIYQTPPPDRQAVADWPNPADATRKRVIFAPHHGLEPGSLGLGTFGWSGQALLDLARAHPDVDFLLRPHPNMALSLSRSGIMTPDQWQAYQAEWQALPNAALFDQSPYWDVFRSSDAMITDSGSFLAEYLPTGAPLIRLERDGAAPLNTFGAGLRDGFYCCDTAADLNRIFTDVVVRGNDPIAPTRAALAKQLTPFDQPAASLIADAIKAFSA